MSEPTMPSERVSRERREAVKAAIDEQALEAAAKALYTSWLGGPGAACMEPWDDDDEDDEADYQAVARNDARTVVTAYLTTAPPERHDAPGVRVDRYDLTHALSDWKECGHDPLWGESWWQQDDQEVYDRLRAALTGQPDAGRDPDAGGDE